MPEPLTGQQIAEDLALLERTLDERFSYLGWKGIDHTAAIGELRDGLGDGAPVATLAIGIIRLLARFGDGHSRIHDPDWYFEPGYLPFRIAPVSDRLVAFETDHTALLDPDRPYLAAIDGVETARWTAHAAELMADGSPQWSRIRTARVMGYLAHLRNLLDLPARDTVRVTLSGEGDDRADREIPVGRTRLLYRPWPDTQSCVLENNVGYLRIPRMSGDPGFVDERRSEMIGMRDTDALIVDVRGNGGGERACLRMLFPFLMRPDDPPHVANVAAYRIGPDDPGDPPEGYMENRRLYPIGWDGWTDGERAAIERCAATFRPSWPLPDGFSDWHYFVVDRPDDQPFTYDRPVVMLIDAGCYSATDIFVGAFADWPGVTLMGTPTAGGSGRSLDYSLPSSGISYQLSSMASYHPTGRLYEGAGTSPDIVVEAAPSDWISDGPDTVLAAALRHLASA